MRFSGTKSEDWLGCVSTECRVKVGWNKNSGWCKLSDGITRGEGGMNCLILG